jgi:cell division initiation protein
MIKDSHEKVIKIHEDITDMKGIRRHFKEELRRLIENHLMMLEFDDKHEKEDSDEVAG